MKKTLVAAGEMFPPYFNGPAILMRNLFQFFPKDNYLVLLRKPVKGEKRVDYSQQLDCNRVYSPIISMRSKIFKFINIIGTTGILMLKILGIFKLYNVRNILIVPRLYLEIPTYIMAKLFSKPYFIYLFDLFLHNTKGNSYGPDDKIVRCFEPILLKSASAVFVMSEPLRDYYQKKYSINSVYIPHTVSAEKFACSNKTDKILSNNVKKVIFTGSIHDYHYNAIENMVKIVNSAFNGEVKLYLYTPAWKVRLVKHGIKGKNVVLDFVKPDLIPSIIKNADILFMAAAFNSNVPNVIKTASPSKLPEYLASGVPILVHAPRESYIAQYFNKNKCGLVVDRNDLEKLKDAVEKLFYNVDLRNTIIQNAKKALEHHDAKKVSKILQNYLQNNPKRR